MYKDFVKIFCKQQTNSKLIQNKNLKDLTTFKINCTTRIFVDICCIEDLFLFFKLTRQFKLKTFCLGGGSKILFCKSRLDYVVYTLSGDFDKIFLCDNTIIAGSGVTMAKLCNFCNRHNLSCVEWGLGIPCKVGGGVYTNAGCFGKSFGDIVKYVVYTDGDKLFIKDNLSCEFSYRKSFFYNKNFTILFVGLNVKPSVEDIKFITIANFNKKVSCQPYNYPSVGSIFKSNILPAPIFIENFGLKGLKIGGAEVSTKHCGFVVNKKNAKARNVLKIICKIKKTVWKKSGIILYNEVILLGEKTNGFFG